MTEIPVEEVGKTAAARQAEDNLSSGSGRRGLSRMWLPLLLLILTPDAVEPNCHDHRYGAPSKSCKRIKDAKFQIRGVKVVPMWEFILLKEAHSGKRAKRSNERNTTLPAANGYYSGGVQQRQFQPYQQIRGHEPLLAQRNLQRTHDASMPAVHHPLIQGVDSHAPQPVQRHVIQRQVQPSILQSSFYSANIAHQSRKIKRQENYQTNAYSAPTTTLSPYTLLPPGPPPLAPAGLSPGISPGYTPGLYSNGQYPTGQQGTKEQEKGEGKKSSKGKKKKKKKGKKNKKNKQKQSKMCKMCEELSAEDSSEEKEVACEICEKASKKRKHGGKKLKEKEKGLLQSALKVKPIHGSKHEEDDEEEEEDEENEDKEDKERREEEEEEGVEGEGAQVEDGDEDYAEDSDDDESGPLTTTTKPTTVSQPTILDYAERAKQNKLMRIPVYRGKKLGATNEAEKNGTDANAEKQKEEEAASEFSSNIRNGTKQTKYSDKPNVKYSYPPKDTLPLQTCFHNPSGYVCCNLELNNIVETTYKEIKEQPNFNPCNLQMIANKVQRASEKMFEHPFESIVSHADFAQNINFAGDLVCKLEIDGKYMIAYGTPYHADDALGPQGPDGKPLPVRSLKRL